MLVVRLSCAFCAFLALAVTLALSFVGLFTVWWTPGPTAPSVVDPPSPEEMQRLGADSSDNDGINSEITLWAHLGCGGNESWANICEMPPEACLFPKIERTTAAAEWRPFTVTTSTTPTPTMDPFRTTTPVPEQESDWACAKGGKGCPRPIFTTTNLEASWGPAPAYPGDGVASGDKIQRVVEEGGVTAEAPNMIPPSTGAPITTTENVYIPHTYGEPLSREDPMMVEYGEKPATLLAQIKEDYMPAGEPIDFGPLAEEYHEVAAPKVSTTEEPMELPGVEEVTFWCEAARDPIATKKFVCGLSDQCGTLSEARMTMFASVSFFLLASGAAIAFGGGGGGYTPAGKDAPTKHLIGFVGAGFSTGGSLLMVVTVATAAGVSVPHNMDGPGMLCASAAIGTALLASLCMVCASLLAMMFPGRDEPAPQQSSGPMDVPDLENLEGAMGDGTEEYPGLKDASLRPLATRVAWQPPNEMASLPAPTGLPKALTLNVPENEDSSSPVSPVSHLSATLGRSGTLALTGVSAQEAASGAVLRLQDEPPSPAMSLPSVPSMLLEAEEVPASSPATKRSLRRFYAGEGGVYAERFAEATLAASPAGSGADSVQSSSRPSSRLQGAWEQATSRQTGEVYYFNRETGEARWGAPVDREEVAAAAPALVAGVPGAAPPRTVWKKKRSRKTGHVYSVPAST